MEKTIDSFLHMHKPISIKFAYLIGLSIASSSLSSLHLSTSIVVLNLDMMPFADHY